MMVRRVLLLLGVAVLLATAAIVLIVRSTGGRDGVSRPNVVAIVIDTLRADRLGCYGYDRPVSPELDALSDGGVRFARAVAQCSWTRPSIGSFLTSLYPRSLGIHFEDRGDLPDRVVTLAEVFHDNGYRTLGATANPHLNPSFNFHQGFDFYLDSINVFDWMPQTLGQVPQSNPPLPPARELFERVLVAIETENPNDRIAPHYLQLVVMDVHETWGENDLVRKEFKALFPDVTYVKERRYLQAVRQVSRDIDWFVEELSDRPGWEDTLVIVVSDHGEGLASHPDVPGSDVHGFLLYESQVMVPWIMFSTSGSLPVGRVVDEPVRLLDLMPTVLDLAGLAVPQAAKGTSLMALVNGGSVDLPSEFVVETHFRGAFKLGVYGDRWKLFHNRDEYPNVNPLELQQIGVLENGVITDEGERHPKDVERLTAVLNRWENENPAAEPVELGADMSLEMIEQLRSLGYLK